jgi:D-arabinose 1-dehydrogenase-like Zn-dependent alcohol dehydrogenase
VCVAVFIWVAARHWSVGKRLGLSLAGSFGIAVAEVAVYSGYVRKVQEAKRKERKKPEIKEIVKSWVIDKGGEKEGVVTGKDGDGDGVRFRKGKHR